MKRILKWLVIIIVVVVLIAAISPKKPKKITERTPTPSRTSVATSGVNKINTLGWEDSPYISPDGTKLYFMSSPWNFYPTFFESKPPVKLGPTRPGHQGNDTNPFEDGNVYVATKQANSSWSTPVRLMKGCCMMPTSDGKKFYMQKEISRGNNDIIFVEQDSKGNWTKITNLGANVNSDYIEDDPHISPGETDIYFNSNRPGGFGDADLYWSHKQTDGSWGQAVNLGPNVNSQWADRQVWVSQDGRTMYFNRYLPQGSVIFRSEFVNGAWIKAEQVKFDNPLPAQAEPSLPNDGQTMYFAGTDSKQRDIFIMYSTKKADGSWSQPQPVD